MQNRNRKMIFFLFVSENGNDCFVHFQEFQTFRSATSIDTDHQRAMCVLIFRFFFLMVDFYVVTVYLLLPVQVLL